MIAKVDAEKKAEEKLEAQASAERKKEALVAEGRIQKFKQRLNGLKLALEKKEEEYKVRSKWSPTKEPAFHRSSGLM